MPIPSSISDLSTVAASNYPSGADSPSTLDDVQRAHASFIAQLRDAIAPGLIQDFGGTTAPTGYLLCDGSAVSRTTYAALFAAISTNWGVGNGTTTFNVPDLRRKVTIGSGGTAVSGPANTVGASGGAETHTLTTAELAAHNHAITDGGHAHTITDPGHNHAAYASGNTATPAPGFAAVVPSLTDVTGTRTTGITINSGTTGITINNNGSGTAHNNMQPSAVVTKIIKT